MRTPIVVLFLMLTLTGCGMREDLDYGNFRYLYSRPAPTGCIIYVTSTNHESANSFTNFTDLLKKYGIHAPAKQYQVHSGPPCADFLNEHVALFRIWAFGTNMSPPYLLRHCWEQNPESSHLKELVSLKDAEGNTQVPLQIGYEMVVHDTHYSAQAFKQMSDSFAESVRAAFPKAQVHVIHCDGTTVIK